MSCCVVYTAVTKERYYYIFLNCTMSGATQIYQATESAVFLFQVTQKSGAHVRVLSDSGEPGCKMAVCFLLQGSKEQVFLARCILENLVTESEPVTVNLGVPQSAFGRIIGSYIRTRLIPIVYLYVFQSISFYF